MAKTIELISLMDSPKLLTLTIVSSDEPLGDQIEHLKDSFRRLRRHKSWKTHVAGGVATFEITFNKKRNQWHPHLHAVIDATFYPFAKLREAWATATGDSWVVDIRKVNSKEGAASYVAKYISKSNNPDEFPASRIEEWAFEVRSLRFFSTFGTMYGRLANDPDDDDGNDTTDPSFVASPSDLIDASNAGDDEATHLLRQLHTLSKRLVPNADATTFGRHKERVREFARRLRAWVSNNEETARDQYSRSGLPPPNDDCTRDRQFRLGEILAPPVRH